jgi:CRP/FNR family transcriptional regulator, anaerobic regulatory protein
MVQTIATLIDETLMVMGAHLHVRMTDEEKAYLDAHFELIHIKKGEHLVTRGEEVCYLYYLESGIVRLWFPDKENREISARFIQAKEFINFFLSHEEHHAHYNIKALEPCGKFMIIFAGSQFKEILILIMSAHGNAFLV